MEIVSTDLVNTDLVNFVWIAWAGLILLACLSGFAAGVFCAPALREWSIQRSIHYANRLAAIVTRELERTTRYCELLHSTSTPLSAEQWAQFDRWRQEFIAVNQRIAERQSAALQLLTRVTESPADSGPLVWQRDPVESATQLPDRSAFDTNLKRMLATSASRAARCGVLLIRMDKIEQLMLRYGPSAAMALQQRIAELIVQSARESDLVCRLAADLFAVLMPETAPLEGIRVAETLRAVIREHAFKFDDEGPTVLVTASFGFTACLPTDPPHLIVDRASEALDRSQVAGRNQLFAHDGQQRALSHIQ